MPVQQKTFVDDKSQQLAHYVEAFLCQQLDDSELELFVWETLEEWGKYRHPEDEFSTETETIFWHLMFLLQRWPLAKLRGHRYLRRQMKDCSQFLLGRAKAPRLALGLRP